MMMIIIFSIVQCVSIPFKDFSGNDVFKLIMDVMVKVACSYIIYNWVMDFLLIGNKRNCLTCKAIHENINCKEYQDDIKRKSINDHAAQRTQKMLQVWINSRYQITNNTPFPSTTPYHGIFKLSFSARSLFYLRTC